MQECKVFEVTGECKGLRERSDATSAKARGVRF